jgi:hypothetical protein
MPLRTISGKRVVPTGIQDRRAVSASSASIKVSLGMNPA